MSSFELFRVGNLDFKPIYGDKLAKFIYTSFTLSLFLLYVFLVATQIFLLYILDIYIFKFSQLRDQSVIFFRLGPSKISRFQMFICFTFLQDFKRSHNLFDNFGVIRFRRSFSAADQGSRALLRKEVSVIFLTTLDLELKV